LRESGSLAVGLDDCGGQQQTAVLVGWSMVIVCTIGPSSCSDSSHVNYQPGVCLCVSFGLRSIRSHTLYICAVQSGLLDEIKTDLIIHTNCDAAAWISLTLGLLQFGETRTSHGDESSGMPVPIARRQDLVRGEARNQEKIIKG